MRRGASAGIAAALVWAATEPLARRAFGTQYTDSRLVGRLVTTGRLWPLAGIAVHTLNGAAFGAVFARAGGRGWKHGVAAAELENGVLWPAMAIIDRYHPDRRSGYWPPLVSNGRVFAQEAVLHALFGAVLGALLSDRR
jgi:hypothetical protein